MAGLYEFGARWSPFVAGALLLVPALVVVARRERRERRERERERGAVRS